jgi:Fe-S-cluster-containing hydrogenase component 2/CRP-like cAMP-binding protein
MAKEVVMPPADLPPHEGDLELPADQLARISLLARLADSTRKGLTRFPGAIRLRRFRRGDYICRQGEEGCTAFYILTGEDHQRLRDHLVEQLAQLPPEQSDEAAATRRTVADLASALAYRPERRAGPDAEPPEFAVVQLATTATARPVQKRGWLERLLGGKSAPASRSDNRPSLLPFDGPRDVNAATGETRLCEGDLFGEMACRNRQPRSASIRALRDGYLLEFLSHILKKIEDDAAYRKEKEETYKRRVLDLHLRPLALFRELSDKQFAAMFAAIRSEITLVSFESGQLIFDENERADAIYLVRDGLVQVRKGTSALLAVADVLNWDELLKALRGESGVGSAIVRHMTERSQALVRVTETTSGLSDVDRQEIVHGLNDAIKNRQTATAAEFKEVLASAAVRDRLAGLPDEQKAWTELDHRRAGRILIEEALPAGVLRRLPRLTSLVNVVTYCARGEVVGEMGVVEGKPRNATCIAYGQPRLDPEQKDLGSVELVRLPAALILQLMEKYPGLRKSVKEGVVQRRAAEPPPVSEARPAQLSPQLSPEAARLGLIQGQKLMLIDLERCTRCDECVRACVDAHTDGRSRLFLVGPRFGKYLVPTTCRSCLDPVCMIGCPVRSIQRGDNREIIIKDWCIGCGLCAKQCPYESIQMHPLGAGEAPPDAPEGSTVKEVTDRAAVCDLCSTTPTQDPACVYACPHEAAIRIDARRTFPVM